MNAAVRDDGSWRIVTIRHKRDQTPRIPVTRCALPLALIDTGARSHEELLQRLQAGDDALGAWLGADRERAGAGGRRTAKQVLLVVCFAILVLAFAVHLAFLVLLVPVGGAMSFLLWTGQDGAWRRMGARRRYEALRLEVPAAWTEDAVRERRDALSLVAERVRERESASGDEDDKAEETRLSTDIEAARSDLREALAAAGLVGDGTDEATEARMLASLPTPNRIRSTANCRRSDRQRT